MLGRSSKSNKSTEDTIFDENVVEAFDTLAKRLKWYNFRSRRFDEEAYKGLKKQYSGHMTTLEDAGLSYEDLGRFIFNYLDTDT